MELVSEVLEEIRSRGQESVGKLDYQKYGDSPTVKFYTKWRGFDEYLKDLGMCSSIGLMIKSDFEKAGIWKFSAHDDLYPLGRLIKPDESKVVAGHYAALRDSLVVEVRDDTDIEIKVGDGLGPSSVHSRHIILVTKKRVNVNILLDATDYEDDALETLFIEGYLGMRSNVNFLILNNPPRGTPSINIFRFALDDYASLNYGYIGSGGYMHHQDDFFLLREKSVVRAGSSFVSGGGGKIDYVSSVVHEGPRGDSHLSSQGIILDDGYGVARGLAKVTKMGEWSKTIFEAGVVLLGEGGKGYASPMLEIDTGNVLEARHEARESRFDVDQLFYLMTRGFNVEEAKSLLIYGLLIRQVSHLHKELQVSADEYIKNNMFFKQLFSSF